MPANVVDGEDAENVANFIVKVAGALAARRLPPVGPASRRPPGRRTSEAAGAAGTIVPAHRRVPVLPRASRVGGERGTHSLRRIAPAGA